METTDIDRVRRFNRTVTLRTGALDDSYLGRGRPLAQARLLFEIGPEGADVGTLRERLGLDSGYLSRLLATLKRQRLITLVADKADRRRRRASLTDAGRVEWDAYDAMSDDLARSMLEPLGASQRQRLVDAMAEVERLLRAAEVSIAVEPVASDDALVCLRAYFRELDERFETGFDIGDDAEPAKLERALDRLLMARLDGRPVGCGALKALDRDTGEIKRMWVAPEARGLGVARRLLAALEAEARRAGLSRIRLDTNRALTEAQALYRKSGYREVARYNDNPYAHLWFEKELD